MVAEAIGTVGDVCASDLGLTAGDFPDTLALEGQMYYQDSRQVENEDLVSVWYVATSGDILRVWND